MPNETIEDILMRRDGMSADEADELIAEAKDALMEHLDSGDMLLAEEVCEEYFGLEPDYLFEIMPF